MLRDAFVSAARVAERGLERIGRRKGAPVLDPYIGYATPEGRVLRARVLTHLRASEPDPEQSRLTNLRQMASLFITDEVAGVAVLPEGVEELSDAEGYVTLTLPGAGAGPWDDVPMRIAGRPDSEVICPVQVPGETARWLVISDVDDTMIETGAHSLARNLWTTFTGSALTRVVHPDAVKLMATLAEGGRNPVFYVSSSPWNLHDFLEGLFARADLPRGPMFLRDLGVSPSGGIGAGHLDHKSAAIDTILSATPDLPVLLLGDSGQKDAHVYRDAIRRHPGRVRGVALREPAPGVGVDDAAAMAQIEAAGVPCYHGPGFGGALEYWGLTPEDEQRQA
ncbi:phosphatase domain-containing protein [Rhodophyticola porphyridii]|uniref:phosphatase domain-containing protein n=1 Tax=Rhodophyticola porphyridii TaxID=1852017 RepID=UPI0035D06F1F